MEPQQLNSVVGAGTMLAVLAFFYTPFVRRSRLWTVTVTPLASIIGSGFLISAPLLYDHFGALAVPAVIVINLLAFAIGLAIRHNILYFDPDRARLMSRHTPLGILGRLSSATLALAYVFSVAFYVSLLTAFALHTFGWHEPLRVKLASTAVLAFIGLYGFGKGLHGLEALEKIAVNLKMSIIAGLLAVLALVMVLGTAHAAPIAMPRLNLRSLQILGGMLIITQGFETTKYLGHQYRIRPRIQALLLAQGIAAAVYIAFVALVAPFVIGVDASQETAIIEIVSRLSVTLGIALSVGAIFSQFSAALADTVGTGGIVNQESRGRITQPMGYLGVAAAAIALLWSLDIFAVMALASRAFASYYGFQCLIAAITTLLQPASPKRSWRFAGFSALVAVSFLIAAFAIPAE